MNLADFYVRCEGKTVSENTCINAGGSILVMLG